MKQTVKVEVPFAANLLLWFEVIHTLLKAAIVIAVLAVIGGFIYLCVTPDKPDWFLNLADSIQIQNEPFSKQIPMFEGRPPD